MIYSRSAEYAIRACANLADLEEGKYSMVKNIAEECNTPTHFLAKILQQLARQGILRSSKGPTGGFALRRPAGEITLLELVSSIDGLDEHQRCPGGMAECNDEAQCGMHDSWKELRERILSYLEDTSVLDLNTAQKEKTAALAKKKKPRKSSKKA
jgi:Rrf2 family transcriptional regulator, iron-sulfur cluster assembly transcription factor